MNVSSFARLVRNPVQARPARRRAAM